MPTTKIREKLVGRTSEIPHTASACSALGIGPSSPQSPLNSAKTTENRYIVTKELPKTEELTKSKEKTNSLFYQFFETIQKFINSFVSEEPSKAARRAARKERKEHMPKRVEEANWIEKANCIVEENCPRVERPSQTKSSKKVSWADEKYCDNEKIKTTFVFDNKLLPNPLLEKPDEASSQKPKSLIQWFFEILTTEI